MRSSDTPLISVKMAKVFNKKAKREENFASFGIMRQVQTSKGCLFSKPHSGAHLQTGECVSALTWGGGKTSSFTKSKVIKDGMETSKYFHKPGYFFKEMTHSSGEGWVEK